MRLLVEQPEDVSQDHEEAIDILQALLGHVIHVFKALLVRGDHPKQTPRQLNPNTEDEGERQHYLFSYLFLEVLGSVVVHFPTLRPDIFRSPFPSHIRAQREQETALEVDPSIYTAAQATITEFLVRIHRLHSCAPKSN